MGICSINIEEMQALVHGMVKAHSRVQSLKSGLTSQMSDLELDTSGLVKVGPVASWIGDELVGLRRRLAMARALAASSPGVGNYVQFDESKLSQRTPAQAKADADQAVKYLKSGDITDLNKLLKTGAYDPYFAAEFARRASTRDLEGFVSGLQGYGQLRGGVSAKQYKAALTGLGQTLGLASRGRGDLDVGQGWRDHFLQDMTAPKFEGDPDDPKSYDDLKARQAGRSALLLIFSKGTWDTTFLTQAATRIKKLDDEHLFPPGMSPPAGYEYAVTAGGRAYDDPVLALMTALSHNPDVARKVFTHGGTTTVPLHGKQVPVNAFVHWALADHHYTQDGDLSVAALALQTAVAGDKTSPIAADVRAFTASTKEAKAHWDAMPWYDKWGHTILDGIGMIPVIGDIANLGSAAWYAIDQDWANAGISAAGCIPFLGDAALGGRLIRDGADGAKLVKTLRMVDLTGHDLDHGIDSAKLLAQGEHIEPGVFKFTSKRDFIAAANHPHPNVTYEYQGIRYTTDSAGRPIHVWGKPLKTRGIANKALRRAIGKSPDAADGDVGFHLFAEAFGGPTTKLNVVPGNGHLRPWLRSTFKNLNNSDYAAMEHQVRHALKDPDIKNVHLDIQPVYTSATSTRPDAFTAVLTTDTKIYEFDFENAPVPRK